MYWMIWRSCCLICFLLFKGHYLSLGSTIFHINTLFHLDEKQTVSKNEKKRCSRLRNYWQMHNYTTKIKIISLDRSFEAFLVLWLNNIPRKYLVKKVKNATSNFYIWPCSSPQSIWVPHGHRDKAYYSP